VQAVMRGEKIIRRYDDEGTKGGIGSGIPVAGRAKPREEPGAGDLEPQPQT
jgi:cell division protease FtsH